MGDSRQSIQSKFSYDFDREVEGVLGICTVLPKPQNLNCVFVDFSLHCRDPSSSGQELKDMQIFNGLKIVKIT